MSSSCPSTQPSLQKKDCQENSCLFEGFPFSWPNPYRVMAQFLLVSPCSMSLHSSESCVDDCLDPWTHWNIKDIMFMFLLLSLERHTDSLLYFIRSRELYIIYFFIFSFQLGNEINSFYCSLCNRMRFFYILQKKIYSSALQCSRTACHLASLFLQSVYNELKKHINTFCKHI